MKKIISGISLLVISFFHTSIWAQGVFFNMVLNFTPSPSACAYFINSGALYMEVNPRLPDTITGGEERVSGVGGSPELINPQNSIAGKILALVNSNHTIALLNARPGYTVIVPALNEQIFCSAMCAVAGPNCWPQCRFAVRNFYSAQKPTYAVPNGTVIVNCPNLNMSKYPYYPSDPYTKFPYTR